MQQCMAELEEIAPGMLFDAVKEQLNSRGGYARQGFAT